MAKVVVACKLPHGLVLRNYEMVTIQEASPLGSRDVQQARPVGERVVLKGTAIPHGMDPREAPPLTVGYALTSVDAEFWQKWVHDNKTHPCVRNGLVFMVDNPAKVADHAKGLNREGLGVRTGLESLDMTQIREKVGSGDSAVERSVPRDKRIPRNPNLTIEDGVR